MTRGGGQGADGGLDLNRRSSRHEAGIEPVALHRTTTSTANEALDLHEPVEAYACLTASSYTSRSVDSNDATGGRGSLGGSGASSRKASTAAASRRAVDSGSLGGTRAT